MSIDMDSKEKIFFSIIVPTYNRAALLNVTLQSLLKLDYINYEIIVVDDGSTDNTEEVVKKLPQERIRYVQKENGERGAARNFGAALANAGYLNFFDSDDVALNNHLNEAVKIIEYYNNPEWFFLPYSLADVHGNILKKTSEHSSKTLNKDLIVGNLIGCTGVFIRKDIFLLNKFNEDRQLAASEDYELWCRMAAQFPLYYSNTVTSLMIDHDERSIKTINGSQLINRIELLVYYLSKDNVVTKHYGSDLNRIKMYAYSYAALHLSDNPKYKSKSIKYLLKGIKESPVLLKKKIFLATARNILLKWN